MGALLFVLSLLGCVLFAYGWGVATGYAVGRGRRWLDEREEQVAWWQEPCRYCGGMVGNHTSRRIIECERDRQVRDADA
jgi:hypothetical protein